MTSTLDVLDSDNVLNRGTVANDNTGDTLRSAGLKINNQFENVDSAMFNTSWAEWPAGVKETNSVLRYNGSKFVGTNNVKIDSDGNTTVSGTLANEGSNGNRCLVKLFRGSTEIGSGTGGGTHNVFTSALPVQPYNTYPFSNSFIDSPSTTSQITYKIQIAANSTSDTAIGGRGDITEVAVPTRITVMEIAG